MCYVIARLHRSENDHIYKSDRLGANSSRAMMAFRIALSVYQAAPLVSCHIPLSVSTLWIMQHCSFASLNSCYCCWRHRGNPIKPQLSEPARVPLAALWPGGAAAGAAVFQLGTFNINSQDSGGALDSALSPYYLPSHAQTGTYLPSDRGQLSLAVKPDETLWMNNSGDMTT